MSRRIVIPAQDPDGIHLAGHFGRAPYFAVFNLSDDGNIIEKNVHPNTGEHAGGRGHAHDNVLQYQPNVVIVHGMGPRGIMSFQSQNIAVLKANSESVDEVVAAYSQRKLEELTEGCADARHR
jgi:predicted Fe-Mo cluster-binding NifX family protein